MHNEKSCKLIPLKEAAALVGDGDCIGLGGMTLYRKPMAFVRELARRRVRDLTVISFTSGFEAELLTISRSLAVLRSCYAGLEFLGLAPALRKSVESGAVRMVEETECTLAFGLQASLMRVPYLPARDCAIGTDFFDIRPDLRREPCPVTGEVLTWVPALAPRVAVIHVPLADRFGNAWLGSQYCVDAQLAMAAEFTIVTAEKVVETAQVREAQGGAGLVSFMVDAVVEAPGGAHPSSCYPDYPMDAVHLARYLRGAPGSADAYLSRYVDNPAGQMQYLGSVLEDEHAFG